MTLLSRPDLQAALQAPNLKDRLVVMPMLDRIEQVGEGSIDVRLGTRFRLPKRIAAPGLDPRTITQRELEESQHDVTVGFGDPFWLHPGQFVLGATLEFIRFPSTLAGYVVGRSSWGRTGLLVATAIMVQPGFAGALTLELVNHGESPVALFAGARVAQLAVHSVTTAVPPYSGKYDGPTGPEVSKLPKERDEIQRLSRVGEQLAGNAAAP